MSHQVTEIVEGEFTAVRADGTKLRVLVPAGVGLAGVEEADLVDLLIGLADQRQMSLPGVVDVSQLFARDPDLVHDLEAAIDSL